MLHKEPAYIHYSNEGLTLIDSYNADISTMQVEIELVLEESSCWWEEEYLMYESKDVQAIGLISKKQARPEW